MAICTVAIHPSVRQVPSSFEIDSALKRFRVFLIADRGLRATTAATYLRMMSKIMRDAGSARPDHDDLRGYVVDLRYTF